MRILWCTRFTKGVCPGLRGAPVGRIIYMTQDERRAQTRTLQRQVEAAKRKEERKKGGQ